MTEVATPAAADDQRITGDILKIAGVVVLGAIMSILDITVVNVALPTFQTIFGTEGQPLAYSTVAWTVTAYTLALATVIPLTGWAADRFGTKRLYMTAITLFTLGSVLCAMASSINMLIAFRVLQGLGGGMLMPLGMTIMTRAAGPKRMGRLMAILGVPMLLGPIGGPILGGWLIDAASWHWIFLINLPIGIIALIYAFVVLPKDAPHPSETFDFVGMLMMSPGLALFLYGVSSIPSEGTVTAPKVLIPGIVGLILLVSFVFYSFKPAHPLLDLRLFRDRNLAVSIITMFLFAVAFFGGLLLVPTYFQQIRGESVLHAGLLVAPQGLGAMLTMPIAGMLTDKFPVGRIVPFGLLFILAGMISLTQITSTTSYTYLIVTLFVMGLGMGGTMMPIMTSALKTLRAAEVARGSTLLNITQQIASSVGVAIMSVILTNGLKDAQLAGPAIASRRDPAIAEQIGGEAGVREGLAQAAHAFAHTYWVAGALVAVTVVAALFLPRKREEAALGADRSEAAPVILH
ncbi:DHA2 family efflux MFS transporter permease subunit [Actinoplanes awajinensis]|uniref:Multidrug transporter n=1 Tax=Actinoplanes awajinensis subsp. mycoplanecinus TaxID=135947 RepID=A0A117MKQ3_9ACTN|nr:DHA2 family efflux MFS transporter permease subunit [Actinoplanes awajinensis]KUL22737.1 multidrug transporter [Actinoplanes awajinensis subsp. mycoplanecinus]